MQGMLWNLVCCFKLRISSSSLLFDLVDSTRHPRLAARESTANNRKIAINHLKSSLCGAFLKKMYEDISLYLQQLLEAAARNGLDPNRLIGEHKLPAPIRLGPRTSAWRLSDIEAFIERLAPGREAD